MHQNPQLRITIASMMISTNPHGDTAEQRQRRALLSLVQGSEGVNWSSTHKGWKETDDDICSWDGISCSNTFDEKGNPKPIVIGIDLSSSGLKGTLPSQLGQLTDLQEIHLQDNQIRGSIPHEITQLTQLQVIDLTDCQLTGTLPHHWASDKLQKLLLSKNDLGGKFFQDVTSPHLASLIEVDLEQNQLDGTLNKFVIERMNKLQALGLSQNQFSGTLPSQELGSLPNLKFLYLDSNQFVGTVSSTMVYQAPLQELWLQDNALSGSIPARFARLENLQDFFIDGNKFTGGLPEEMCKSNVLNYDFFQTEASMGIQVPIIGQETHCDSIACHAGSISMEGMHPCTECESSVYMVKLHPYLGQRGESCRDWSQRDILQMFYSGASQHEHWRGEGSGGGNDKDEETNSNDWTNGEDECEFTGITCDGQGNVIKIDLHNSSLSGTISEAIGFLPYLEELDLSDNDLTGYLPSDLRWADLTKIDITGNRIRGVVPPLLCLMEGVDGNCDKIACPSGTYNARGRYVEGEDGKDQQQCLTCFDGTPFIGQTNCIQKVDPHSIIGELEKESEVIIKSAESLDESTKFGLVLTLAVAVGTLLFCCGLRRGRQWKQMENKKTNEERNKMLQSAIERTVHKYQDNTDDFSFDIVRTDDVTQSNDSSESSDTVGSEEKDDEEALWWAIQRYGEDHDVVKLLRRCSVEKEAAAAEKLMYF